MTRPRARKRTQPLDRLSADEATEARELTRKLGTEQACRALGICDVRTLHKALAELPVHSLTASTIRASLTTRKI